MGPTTTLVNSSGVSQMQFQETSRLFLVFALFCPLTFASSNCHAQDQAGGKPVTVDVFGTGQMQVPAEFKQVKPKMRMIAHEFQASAGEGDEKATARLTMMVSGGGVKANIRRWKGQFAGGDKAKNKTEEMEVGKWKVHIVDLNGSYAERMGGGPFAGGKVVQRENYAMTGAIIMPKDAGPNGQGYFVKMIGPANVIQANRQRMVDMIKSLEK